MPWCYLIYSHSQNEEHSQPTFCSFQFSAGYLVLLLSSEEVTSLPPVREPLLTLCRGAAGSMAGWLVEGGITGLAHFCPGQSHQSHLESFLENIKTLEL